jgi:phosphate starvation-inducible PhoH-like protein
LRQTGPEAGRKAPWERTAEPETAGISLTFGDNRLASVLFGRYGENLALIERRLGVTIDQRGNMISIAGSREAGEKARRALEGLYEELRAGRNVTSGDVEGAIRAVQTQTSLFDGEPPADKTGFDDIRLRKRAVRARTPMQDAYIRAMKRHTLVFGIGPAGTGKTWLAVAHAVHLYERREVDRIVLSRPAVEAGERLGFLPGDMREKVDPYLRPMYDALYDMMDRALVERALQSGEIEIAPIAFMRGRTLANAAVILDEAQNTSPMQMKMFLTRLGEHSRMIVTGDPSQIDLPAGQSSGLVDALRLLEGIDDVAQVRFTSADVVRHELVSRIVAAYDADDETKKKEPRR